jgi:AcrR family transcriptional regulator
LGRNATFTDEDVFACVAEHMALTPQLTVQQLSKGSGVSVGSLYHRYGSMEGVLAQAWLWSVRRFQTPLFALLAETGPQAGLKAALHTLRFAMAERTPALILACCPRAAFLGDGLSEALAAEVATVNDEISGALADFVARSGFDPQAAELAIVRLPLAIVQMYLPQRPVPRDAEIFVKKGYRAIIKLGQDDNDQD